MRCRRSAVTGLRAVTCLLALAGGAGQASSRDVTIPLAPAAASALRGAVIELSIKLREAHGTAPVTPLRFRGPLAVAPPP